MARLLGDGGLADEARTPLLEAAHALARALAVENRLPEPATLHDALLPPLAHCWRDALALLRGFVADEAQPWKPLLERLEQT
jgi:hypothetical protein